MKPHPLIRFAPFPLKGDTRAGGTGPCLLSLALGRAGFMGCGWRMAAMEN
jgi:hypothetical protein